MADLYIGSDTLLLCAGHLVPLQVNGVVVNRLTVRIQNLHLDVRGLILGAIGELGRNTDKLVIAGGDIERMASEEEILRCRDDTDVAEESASGVPT